MTPSDEAVEKAAEMLYERLKQLESNHTLPWDELLGPEQQPWLDDARAVLDAAFPPNTYDAESEYAKGRADEAMLRGGSGEYQRAVSDVVETVRERPSAIWREVAMFIEQRFAPTSEGEE